MKLIKNTCLFSALLVATFCLNGCLSVGPDYEQPEIKTPDVWGQAIMHDFQAGTNSNMQNWWTLFDDDVLNELIVMSSTNNPDLMIAAERIVEAAALRGIAKSLWFPQISGDGAATRVQVSEKVFAPLPGGDNKATQYSIGGSMTWELDLWGRVRRHVEASDASMQATVEDYRDTMVMLYAEIAYQYMQVRALQTRIILAKESISLQQDTLKLTTDRNAAGLSPDLDIYQAKMNLAQTKATIPPLVINLARAVHRLGVLSGQEPSALREKLQCKTLDIPKVPNEIMIGLPADLLRQRPDVRSAERRLASQHAMIGAKKAELYPTFMLPGTLNLQAYDSSDSGGDALGYTFGPAFRWNLFNGGRIRSQVEAEESRTKQASINYERVVLSALEDVENAMVAITQERKHIVSLDEAVVASRKSVELVKDLYKSGLTDFQNVLSTERSYMFQQDRLAEAEGSVAGYAVQLYKALGGGWSAGESNEN